MKQTVATPTTRFGNGRADSHNGIGVGGDGNGEAAFPVPLPLNRPVIGLLIFIATELMFFAGLISAYLILKAGAMDWPPPGQPRLPVEVTALNTLVLLFSGFTMYRARKLSEAGSPAFLKWLTLTGALGTLFLLIQGNEWVRLVQYGLTLSSSLYGATFYTLIGAHGVHVLIAVVALLFVLGKALAGGYREDQTGVVLCQIYWFFVVGIWPVLYLLVYFN